MIDFNILNRAVFDDKQIRHQVIMAPHLYEGGNSIEIGPDSVYWVKHIDWKFGYFDVNMPLAKEIKVKPIEVWVNDILKGDTTPYPPFVSPKPVKNHINFRVKNNTLGNNMQLKVEFFLTGVLVRPKEGAEMPSLKEQLGYIMLSEEKKGELAMAEAAIDLVDEKMLSAGMETIRSKFPQGLGMLTALPKPLQNLLLSASIPGLVDEDRPRQIGGSSRNEQLKLAMDADPQKEKSAFMGDMMAGCPTTCQGLLNKESLQTIAEFMIQNGWRKI